jgi:hypothetical protein
MSLPYMVSSFHSAFSTILLSTQSLLIVTLQSLPLKLVVITELLELTIYQIIFDTFVEFASKHLCLLV